MPRLTNALVAALALHGLLLLVRFRHAPAPQPAPPQELVEVEPSLEEPPPSDEPQRSARASPTSGGANAPSAQSALRATSRVASPNAASDTASASDATAATASDGAATLAAPPGATSSEAPARKVDLGLDGHFFLGPPSEELPRVGKSGIQRQLEASLAASDVQHGLARGNALLGSLNAAVRQDGPVRGEALVRVTVSADGVLTDVQFVQGAAADWANALKAFRELARSKRVRVPPGARGLRVTFSVRAKVQLPSGEEVSGPHLAGPTLEPNGLTPHGTFDVADIGSGSQRLVYAHVVSEEVL